MSEIFGKMRMPKAFNSADQHRREERAGHAAEPADHDHDEASTMMRRSMA